MAIIRRPRFATTSGPARLPRGQHTAILLHDSFSPWVREGIALAGADGHPKVALCQLDFVSGGVWTSGPFEDQMWGGFALVLIDETDAVRALDRMQVWLDGPQSVPAGFDAWETVLRAEPIVAELRRRGTTTALARARAMLRKKLR